MICRIIRLFIHMILVVSALQAQTNLDFEVPSPDDRLRPDGWHTGGRGYSFQLDHEKFHGGDRSLRLEYTALILEPGAYAVARQRISIEALTSGEASGAGRLRLHGFLRSAEVEGGFLGLWLRIDDAAGRVLAFDNMAARELKGTTEWTPYEIVLVVSPEASRVTFGALLSGSGSIWVDDLSLEMLPPLLLPNAEATAYLDSALDIMRQHALRRDAVNWPEVRARALDLARGAEGPARVHGAIRYALGQLGDGHSFLMTPEQNQRWREAPAPPPSDSAVQSGSTRQQESRVGGDVDAGGGDTGLGGRLVRGSGDKSHGYVRIPGFASGAPGAALAFAEDLTAIVAELDAARPCGWIVDLRQNTGGNMYPMLLGLGPILGPGKLGTFVAPGGETTPWAYEPGRILVGGSVRYAMTGEPLALYREDAPVAVLTGERTASSGEAVVVAFRGRPATRSFGAGTRGQSSANRGFSLSDGAMIFLTTSVFADRTGRIYGGVIEPDVRVEGTPRSELPRPSLPEDPVVRAALTWLESVACPKTPE